MRKLGVVFASVVCIAALVAGAPAVDARTRYSHRVNLHRNAPEYSINWSGYAVPAKSGEAIGAVRGSWLVPQINGAPPGFSSSWIGIGGYETSDLIQVGTASSGYLERNYAWYEMLPEYAIPITSGCAGDNSCAVAQGDRMAASIDNVGGDTWVIMLANLGKGAVAKWHWAMTATYKSSRSSAEWIFEAPQIGVGPVGVQTIPANAPHAKFLGGDYAVNGITRPLARSDASRIIMVLDYLGVVRTGTPSLMAPDGHFQVCAYKRTCPNF